MKHHALRIIVITPLLVLLVACSRNQPPPIQYGISPFQDTAMPVVAQSLGLYDKAGLNVQLVTLPWEDVIPSLASRGRTIDLGLGSINLLLPRTQNINIIGGGDVIFYYPLYVFKGAALMMHRNSGLRPVSYFLKLYPNDQRRALREAMQQIKGMTVGLPQGTPYEQMLMAAFNAAGKDYRKEVDLRYVKLADALPAFLSNQLDIAGAGVTQRTEVERSGDQVFLQMDDIGFAEIIGIVTTKHFAETHKQQLADFIRIWFDGIDYLMADVDHHSAAVLSYLAKNASTKYTLDEYKKALNFQVFPRSEKEARELFFEASGRYYWKRTWDIVDDYLLTSGAIKQPTPYSYFGTE
jgi:ABC-type nitrate/sulfonate/bicarbonate transport system substrate-binding protein